MIPLIKLPKWQFEFVRGRLISFAFWALAVMVLVNIHWLHLWGLPMVRPVGYVVILIACLLLLALVGFRRWKSPGMPALLVFTTIASYLLIGSGVSFVTGAEWQQGVGKNILRQAFFFIILLAVTLGSRMMLERIGIEQLLKGVLVILIASCLIVLVSPILRDLGVLPLYRLPFRFTGAFTDPNDAGFIGCMAIVLALAFICHGVQRKLAYLSLTLGYGAILVSFSKSASLLLCVLSIFVLLTNGFGKRNHILRYLPILGLGAIVIHLDLGGHLNKVNIYPDYSRNTFCSTVSSSNPGLRSDCSILLAARDPLSGGVALNWSDSVPIPLWQGVMLQGRVVGLDLSHMNLSGRIPPELGGLDQLVLLRLNHNRLTGPIPLELGKLSNLMELNLDENELTENELTGPVPLELGKLSNLMELNLDENELTENELTGPVPLELGKLSNLMELNLDENELTGSAPAEFLGMKFGRDTSLTVGGEKLKYGFSGRRIHMWRSSLDKIWESPILGSGIGIFRSLDSGALNHEGEPVGIHNTYLRLIGEAGIVPLLLYCLFLFSLMWLQWATPRSLARSVIVGCTIAISLYCVAFQHLLTMGTCIFFSGLSCALAATIMGSRLPSNSASYRPR